jgi:hypothetical protein
MKKHPQLERCRKGGIKNRISLAGSVKREPPSRKVVGRKKGTSWHKKII